MPKKAHICFGICGPYLLFYKWATLGTHPFGPGQKKASSAASLPEVGHIRLLSGNVIYVNVIRGGFISHKCSGRKHPGERFFTKTCDIDLLLSVSEVSHCLTSSPTPKDVSPRDEECLDVEG